MEKVYMYEGFKKYLNEISSPTHEDFIALCAMYHPGTLEKIPHYIARKQGKEPIEYIHPVVEKYFKETYGVLVYKEQIISLFQEIANFTTKECDELCAKMCRLMQSTLIWEYHKKFVNQGVLNGYDEQILEHIWYFIERNAIYIGSKAETEANLLIKIVDSFEDIKIKIVDSFEGVKKGSPQISICGESGGNGRTCQLAERFGSCDPFAERES